MIFIGETNFFPNPPMEQIGKAVAPPTGHVAVIQLRDRMMRTRLKAEMNREISLEVQICEDFVRSLIKEKPEELCEIHVLVGHE